MTSTNRARPQSPRTFTGPALKEIAFPLGGIGTGTVSLGGRGELRDWEIFNRPAKGKNLPFTFFALWARPEGGEAVTRVLERRLLPPFAADHGLAPSRQSGLPRLAEARFEGSYPLARIAFADAALPVQVALEAFNPMIPHDDENSGLPVVYFLWRIGNLSDRPVDLTVAFSLLNAIGFDGQEAFAANRGRRLALFGGNRNTWRSDHGLSGLAMTRDARTEAPGDGSLAVATTWPTTTFLLHWERAGWFDDLQSFWDGFRAEGRLADDPTSTPSPEGETDVGSLGLTARVAPGETVELPFILAWHLPNLTNYWNAEPTVRGARLGNYYTTQFADAWDAARYAAENRARLEAQTRLFHDALVSSTLPAPVLDAVSSQISTIRTTTGLRTEDGRFHAFEGCSDNAGCCPMNCTHVWNYEQALAFLYPSLERTMRLTDFDVNTRPSGEMSFRTLLPVTSGALWDFEAAADGQMGCVLKLYREWQISGDDKFLRDLWPHAKRALAFAWQQWDADRDGVMEGEQHNTYDIEFYGPNTLTGTLYLGALKAAALIARHLGEVKNALEYERLYESGRTKLDALLWNGSYYAQHVRRPEVPPPTRRPEWHSSALVPGEDTPRYQYGPGCLADQLLGQWFARVVGLGDLLPAERTRSAVESIYRHNWRTSLANHESCQRTYALNDEAGLLLCSWPNGGRPTYPFPYSDECWTGIEYQVAAHLIYEGLVEEGLTIVAGVRERHDGVKRNPWNEFECGNHYARALSSWSLLLALSGYQYCAPEARIGFAPRINADNFRCFFSTGAAWGVYAQSRVASGQESRLEVLNGTLSLRRVDLALPAGSVAVAARGPAGPLAASVEDLISQTRVDLGGEVTIGEGGTLTITARAE
ncbi:MAG TPA: GH116 family glycosyl-hydrolase [Chloroflexota bacterium]|nr:GH116 family glycosyl-hydrolase [Chloroflexota bacterium]